jgi:hypothetical protein
MIGLKRLAIGGGVSLSIIGYYAIALIGVGIHLWTVLIALSQSGFIVAAITLAMPGFAEIFWMVSSWFQSGIFLTVYTAVILTYALLVAVSYGLIYFFVSKIEE